MDAKEQYTQWNQNQSQKLVISEARLPGNTALCFCSSSHSRNHQPRNHTRGNFQFFWVQPHMDVSGTTQHLKRTPNRQWCVLALTPYPATRPRG